MTHVLSLQSTVAAAHSSSCTPQIKWICSQGCGNKQQVLTSTLRCHEEAYSSTKEQQNPWWETGAASFYSLITWLFFNQQPGLI